MEEGGELPASSYPTLEGIAPVPVLAFKLEVLFKLIAVSVFLLLVSRCKVDLGGGPVSGAYYWNWLSTLYDSIARVINVIIMTKVHHCIVKIFDEIGVIAVVSPHPI
jgi:hypothetical protein